LINLTNFYIFRQTATE